MDIFLKLKQDILDWYKGVLAAAAYCVVMDFLFGKVCPMVLLTGLPCPACGLTRAGIAFFLIKFSLCYGRHGKWNSLDKGYGQNSGRMFVLPEFFIYIR